MAGAEVEAEAVAMVGVDAKAVARAAVKTEVGASREKQCE